MKKKRNDPSFKLKHRTNRVKHILAFSTLRANVNSHSHTPRSGSYRKKEDAVS